MNYSINNVTDVADCNVLLSWAAKEKADLNFKKLSDERLTARYATTAAELDADLQVIMAEIAATDTVIAMLPEGSSREDAMNKKTRLEYKKFLLEVRKESNGVVALLEKEADLAGVINQLSEIDAFINLVETRKRDLTA
ncbi:hypothetical protein KIH23_04875 [Flavobacterium sp. CYK-55]|uniref:hypothetical protein n=1 Tax=Flavobacterium sp. CYK-55 TaxID=2835529 RepID=UPI001BCA9FD5|nr:hypothetical protein [Flavobacterium sp. CYK-55]MBS7786621.1 hypothetical protein [Flavobacterium sp. CYK-55]